RDVIDVNSETQGSHFTIIFAVTRAQVEGSRRESFKLTPRDPSTCARDDKIPGQGGDSSCSLVGQDSVEPSWLRGASLPICNGRLGLWRRRADDSERSRAFRLRSICCRDDAANH